METFLQMVAHDLYQKIGNDFSHTAIVFPNKRASLFFNKYLASESDRPLWAPTYVTISELFQQQSILKLGDPIQLVCELYNVFREVTNSTEMLDDFYFWGELLISDFDDADKNLVDTGRLFTNLQDLKDIMDSYDFLEPEQEEALKLFFQNFSIEKRTKLKQQFIAIWDKLGEIYLNFRERLEAKGIAYEGMLYRHAIEKLQADKLPFEKYVFVGFNVLNKVERKFFLTLQEAGKALFYWDYDIAYTRIPREQQPPYTHEAGEFILRNLETFPNQLPESLFNALYKHKNVRIISSSTENAQAKFLASWKQEEEGSAVVLCNEALLLPVLHSIPPQTQNINITMGFPLSQTPAYSYINALAELQTEGYLESNGRYAYDKVTAVLKHPYVRLLSPVAETLEKRLTQANRFYPFPSELQQDDFLTAVFTPSNGSAALCRYLTDMLSRATAIYREGNTTTKEDIYNQLYKEAIFKSYTSINRFLKLIEDGNLAGLKTATLKRLLKRLLTTTNIPFHGEPAKGLQIMGVLETRNLDFRNLVMLSVNEGQLPKGVNDSSFIPYNLRKAFGMTTIEHKNAVYAYYFYRLIQRAEDITILYNNSSDGLNRGEMSRFALQFFIDYPYPIERMYLEARQTPQRARDICVEKTHEVIRKMCDTYDIRIHPRSILSPSALNTYLNCPLMFYYRYVARIKVPDEVNTEIDSALFGTIFHRSAELLYSGLTAGNKEVDKASIEALLKNDVKLQSYVDSAFKEIFFHVPPGEQPEYNGTQLIHSKVILSYLRQLLKNDLQYAPFRMEGMEQRIYESIEIDTESGKVPINIGGTIDRMDSKDGTLRIVDYKTGGEPQSIGSIGQLFEPGEDRPGYIFQTFLYAAIMCRRQEMKVSPALLYIHKAASPDYSPTIKMGMRQGKTPVDDFGMYEEEFRTRLRGLLQEIFDPAKPFTQTEGGKYCAYCDFNKLCKRS